MPDRQGEQGAAEAEEDPWTSAALGEALAHPHPGAKVARMQRAALDPRLRAKYVRVDYPEGWAAQPREIAPWLDGEGYLVHGDSGSPQTGRPPWFDEQLFLDGQRFSRDCLAGLSQADMLSLFFLFGFPGSLDPLVATANPNRTDCKGEPRALNCPAASLVADTLSGISSGAYAGPCPVLSTLGPDYPSGAILVDADRYRRPFLSQAEMAITQWGFFGLFICKPEVFAAPRATRRELEGLVHMWAVLGYCLGIEDRFNWGLGGLDVVLRRSEEFLRYVAVPSLRALVKQGPDRWEHMSRAMMDGMRAFVPLPSFEANLAYLTEDVLGLGTVLPKALTWRQTLQLWRLRLVLQYLPRWFTSWTSFMSSRLRFILRKRAKAIGLRGGRDVGQDAVENAVENAFEE
ncbi:uncharacterized protein LOC117644662 [Thrips palmi]|uniref:Uncharacterized protein LOC117644662 n=1 Tax=Thrips palmi TaxID=161013 RepID=A0A6P8ZM85_THRPL|nr:uncharacterized protein LOC117644662 [Thrips palmi]